LPGGSRGLGDVYKRQEVYPGGRGGEGDVDADALEER
jgi:hypothetical protein